MKLYSLLLIAPLLMAEQSLRVVELEKDGTDQLQRIAGLIQLPSVKVIPDASLGLVSIIADTPEKAEQAEQLLRKYYKPVPKTVPKDDKNVELTVQFLFATTNPADGTDVPASLTPVVQQLKQSTKLTSFRVAETSIARTRSGKRLTLSGILDVKDVPEKANALYNLEVDLTATERLVMIDRLRCFSRMPVRVGEKDFQYHELQITSSLDLSPGQTAVVGKSNSGTKDGALILVVTTKIVN